MTAPLIDLIRQYPGITTPELVETTNPGSPKWRHHVIAELRRYYRHGIVKRRLIRSTLRPAVAWWLTTYGERVARQS